MQMVTYLHGSMYVQLHMSIMNIGCMQLSQFPCSFSMCMTFPYIHVSSNIPLYKYKFMYAWCCLDNLHRQHKSAFTKIKVREKSCYISTNVRFTLIM